MIEPNRPAPSAPRPWLRLNRIDLLVVLGLTAIVALTGAFLLLADEVMEGGTKAFDQAILMALRTPGHPEMPLGPIWLQDMARDVTSLGSFAILGLIVLAVVSYLLLSGRWRVALLVLVSVLGGVAISQLLKAGYDRPRPDLAAYAHLYTESFPSGHAMLSAVTYLTLGALLERTMASHRLKFFFIATAVVLTLLVGCSRVYLGVHYPTDVLAGWCLGSIWALTCLIASMWLERRWSHAHGA